MRINFIDRQDPKESDFFIRTENISVDIPEEAKDVLLGKWKSDKMQEYKERNLKLRELTLLNKETLKEIKEGFYEFVKDEYPEELL